MRLNELDRENAGIRHSKCASSFVLDLRRKKTTTVIAVKLTVHRKAKIWSSFTHLYFF